MLYLSHSPYVKYALIKTDLKKLFAILVLFFLPLCFLAQDKEKTPFVNLWSLKTNVFEWLVTVPNVGMECDIVRSPFKKMSLGLTAKYNWNTYHSKAPAMVFDLLDIRPEYRYYFRTDDRRYSRPWWLMYVGAYASYGTYAFKLSEKGIKGETVGMGVSFGYVIPVYEYKRGAIDFEFGFSLGLQGCTRDAFMHNPEGYYYTKIEQESKGMHVTPFPVISEIRAAFAWRKESVRHQVKIDVEKEKRLAEEEKNVGLVLSDIEAMLPISMAMEYREREAFEAALMEQREYLVGENAVRNPVYGFSDKVIKRLDRRVAKRCRELQRIFDKDRDRK